MSETVRLDGVDIALNAESVTSLFTKMRNEVSEYKGRLDAVGAELKKACADRDALKKPEAINARVQERIKLVTACKTIVGDEERLDSLSDSELKLQAIKKRFPDMDLSEKSSAYIDGVFATIIAETSTRTDSLADTRSALQEQTPSESNPAYEKWLSQSAKLWQQPLSGKF